VRFPSRCYLGTVVLGFGMQGAGQSVPPNAPVPRSAADTPVMMAPTPPSTSTTVRRSQVDPIELQREAKQIVDVSQSLRSDIADVNRGVLTNEMIEKLKRIEKLSKQLRGQIGW
jgi:hypothetical protein